MHNHGLGWNLKDGWDLSEVCQGNGPESIDTQLPGELANWGEHNAMAVLAEVFDDHAKAVYRMCAGMAESQNFWETLSQYVAEACLWGLTHQWSTMKVVSICASVRRAILDWIHQESGKCYSYVRTPGDRREWRTRKTVAWEDLDEMASPKPRCQGPDDEKARISEWVGQRFVTHPQRVEALEGKYGKAPGERSLKDLADDLDVPKTTVNRWADQELARMRHELQLPDRPEHESRKLRSGWSGYGGPWLRAPLSKAALDLAA